MKICSGRSLLSTWAFWIGETRQHTTARQYRQSSKKTSLLDSSNATATDAPSITVAMSEWRDSPSWPRVKTRLFYFSATTLLWSSIANPSDVIITISSSRKLWVFFMMFNWIQNSYQVSVWLNSCSQLLGAWSLAVEAQRWSQTLIEEIGASSQQANCMTTQLKLLSPAYHLWEPAHSKSLRWGFCSLNMLSVHHLCPSNWFSNVIVHCTYESWIIIINPSLHLSLFAVRAFPWHQNPALQQSFQVWLFLFFVGFQAVNQ